VKTFKARPAGETVPDLLIEATEEIPRMETADVMAGKQRERFQAEAIKIVDAMYASLPGGVLHHVFAEMARRRACELVVAL